MNSTPSASLTPHEVMRLLLVHRKTWITSTAACGLLAVVYALVAPRYWEASQALVVRQETAGSASPVPGKFADLYEMRTLQETILELAKSQQVVVATIQAVDRRLTEAEPRVPTAEDIEEFRNRLQMLPPHGGEFGKTEVFYLYLKDPNRERAVELVGELCRQLDMGMKQLRATRASGLVAELEEQVELAAATHAGGTAGLVAFESEVGADLGELRMLHSASSGQSDMRQEAVILESDVRRFQTQARETEQLLALLRVAEKDPQQLVATPNSLLTSQPGLRRLKDGLVDAQLATARVSGTRSDEHPRVKAAVEAEAQIRDDLHHELAMAIQGAEVELRLGNQRVAATQDRLTNLQNRLAGLAERRGAYSNHVAAVDNSRVTLDHARQNLSRALAAEAAANSGSLVTRIDQPETGPYPAGPGRTVIAGAGGVAGLMLGLGLVFLGAAPRSPESNHHHHYDEASGGATLSKRLPAETHNGAGAPPAAPERWDAGLAGGSRQRPRPFEPVAETDLRTAPEQLRREPTPAAMIAEPIATAMPPVEEPIWNGVGDVGAEADLRADDVPSHDVEPAPFPTVELPAAQQQQVAPLSPSLIASPIGAGPTPSLPSNSAGAFGGMSLQEALRAAGAQSYN